MSSTRCVRSSPIGSTWIRPRCPSICRRPISRRTSRRGASGCVDVAPFDPPTLESALRGLAEARGIKPAALIHATRVAVVGQAVSPGLFEVLALVGRDRVIARLEDAMRVVERT